MSIIDWIFNFEGFNRKIKLQQRKKSLGERFTSDLTWRKFTCEVLSSLNSTLKFIDCETIYEIGWINGKDKYFQILQELITEKKYNEITKLKYGFDEAIDEMGYIPVGEYFKIFIWKLKNESTFIQVIKGSFESSVQLIILESEIEKINIKKIKKRRLIYPV